MSGSTDDRCANAAELTAAAVSAGDNLSTASGLAAGPESTAQPTLAAYRLVGRLGTGAMGVVWKAHDPVLDRYVAIKVVKAAGSEPSKTRLLREAKAAAKLSHPNAITVHHVAEHDGEICIVMELLGASLADELRARGPLPWREATQAIRDAAAGLAAAHAAGLVHRDIKPSNLLRGERGAVKVADFGLVCSPEAGDVELTGEGALLGTPAYMSPEQCRGEPADARSDVYALGCSYFHLLTGHLPFEAETAQDVMHSQCFKALPDPRRWASGLPDAVGRVLSQALEKDPSKRYADAGEMLAALEALLPPPGGVTGDVSPPNNLPRQRTSFVGRGAMVTEIGKMLEAADLLTLTGPGGTGKTRLALEIAGGQLAAFPDGVWLVELSAVNEPSLVPQAIAWALGVREEPGKPLADTLAERLREVRALLLLDNCEHLIDACARAADGLLQACRKLKLLATSREPLRIAGERVVAVPPLAVPEAAAPVSAAALLESDAARLFVERASTVDRRFALTDANAAAVAELCRRLDGIPLALELAAARVPHLGVEQILSRLGERFQVLTAGLRDAPARQQTLAGMIDWSHDLLSEAERTLFRRLAVFAGGWTLDSAERVCSGDGIEREQIMGLLARLVDQSLVVTTGENAGRYGFLETIQRYAAEKLAASGLEKAMQLRHVRWCLELAGPSVPAWAQDQPRPDRFTAADAVEAEKENIRAAFERAVVDDSLTDEAVRLAAAITHVWITRINHAEASDKLDRALARGGWMDIAARGLACTVSAHIDSLIGSPAALPRADEGVELHRQLGDSRKLCHSLSIAAATHHLAGDPDRASAMLDEALSAARANQLPDQAAFACVVQGEMARIDGDLATARQRNLEAVRIDSDPATPVIARHASPRLNLGDIELRLGNLEAARAWLGEGLEIAVARKNLNAIATALDSYAALAMAAGRPVIAATLLSRAAAIRRESAAPINLTERNGLEQTTAEVKAALKADDFDKAIAEGTALTIDEAVALAKSV